MNTTYKLTSEVEPTLKQLDDLMTEVIKVLKIGAVAAELKIIAFQKAYTEQVELHQLVKKKSAQRNLY